jgi:Tfp pilus assembly protein PilO
MKALQDELRTKQQTIAQDDALLRQIEFTSDQLEEARRYVADWQETSPRESGATALFGQISRLTKQSGMSTTRFEPQQVVERRRVREIPLQLGVQGSLAEFFALLAAVEKLPPLIWVDELKIERNPKSDDLQCELKLALFADKSEISD